MPFTQRVWLFFRSLSPSKFGEEISSFAALGCLFRIPDPESEFFSIPDPRSWIQIFFIPDPCSRIQIFFFRDPGSQIHIKEFKYFNQKKWFLSSQIHVFHPGSGSRIQILTFYPSRITILDPRSRIQRSKRHRDPWSRIRIRNTEDFGSVPAVGGSVGYWLSTIPVVLTTHSIDQLSEVFMCKKFSHNLSNFYCF